MSSFYRTAAPEQKEAWLQAYIKRRLDEGYSERSTRKRSDNGKIVSVGIQSALRKKAKIAWAKKAKHHAPKSALQIEGEKDASA